MGRSFDSLVDEAAEVSVEGWDFSWLDGRATEERPSWGYQRLRSERLAKATAALDIQTGGGEVLAGAGAENFPPTLVATEGWPPNVAKATALLHPLGRLCRHGGRRARRSGACRRGRQSYGGFTAPIVADRQSVDALVLVAGMIPAPGERPADWWTNTGYRHAVEEQARRDGGLTGSDDPFVAFYHDVPRDLAEKAMSRERSESDAAYNGPWPLDSWPDVPARFVVCTEDRFFPAPFLRQVVAERLGIVADEIAAGHCVALSRPEELGNLLDSYAQALAG